MSVGRICSREVRLAEETETAVAAAWRMRQSRVGCLVIVDRAKRPIGLVTDRDLAMRVLAEGRDPSSATVAETMTRNPRNVREETSIESALGLMRAAAVSRLPVVNGAGELVGIVSFDDVLALLAEELAVMGELLGRQVPPGVLEKYPASM